MDPKEEPAAWPGLDSDVQQVDREQAQTSIEAAFLPVDAVLLQAGPKRPFDLYQRVEGNMVLLCARDYPLTQRQMREMRDGRQNTLFVPVAQGPLVSWHVEGILREVILDERMTVDRRSTILISSARTIMSEVLANPSAKGAIRRGIALANTTVNFVAQEPAALRSLATLFTKDYCTYTHCVRTCVLGVALYKYIISPKVEYLRRFGVGMLLHDTGKSLLEHCVLNKPERLTEEEFDHVKSHPALGWQILASHGIKDDLVKSVALHHHEKLDGSGYPEGLAGPNIAQEARVAAVVDVYDALASERPYRNAMSHEQALALMGARMVGNHLDPECFTGFVKISRHLGDTRPAAAPAPTPAAAASRS